MSFMEESRVQPRRSGRQKALPAYLQDYDLEDDADQHEACGQVNKGDTVVVIDDDTSDAEGEEEPAEGIASEEPRAPPVVAAPEPELVVPIDEELPIQDCTADLQINPAFAQCHSLSDFFEFFIPNDILQLIVEQTNLYAQQQAGPTKPRFEPTCIAEIKAFIGLNFIMELKWQPRLRDYWSTDPTRVDPFIANVIPRNRFFKLLYYFHLSDNAGWYFDDPDRDRFYKFRPLYDLMLDRCRAGLTPGRDLAVDELMIGFHGRQAMRQWMPKKPTPRGFKVWVCALPSLPYTVSFELYKGTRLTPEAEKPVDTIVLRLTEGLQGQWRRVIFDQYFTMTSLATQLLERQTYSIGAMVAGRAHDVMPHLPHGGFHRGDSIQYRTDGLTYTLWKDKKPRMWLSTGTPVLPRPTVKRWAEDGHARIDVPCPQPIRDYQLLMGGVDHVCQMRGYYEPSRRSRKWYMRLVWYLLYMAVLNAWSVYRITHPGQMVLLDFYRELALELIGDYCSVKRGVYIMTPVEHMHRIESGERMRHCVNPDCRKRTRAYCPECNRGMCRACMIPAHQSLLLRGQILCRTGPPE
eukprot:gnl/Trimastix_PCT/2543.p1 GENE.gnl/Trimastix_PCT/2543~~gnl/Trimastix_PCT/2543.p1  ORF type:complete len:577 (-),score=91.92 gnl/Trimastix_PCT/2543:1563-3293(-)